MFCMRMGHIPQPVRAYGGSLFDRLLRLPAGFTHLSSAASQRLPPNRRPGPRPSPAFAGPVVLRRAGVHVLRIGFDKGRGGREPCGQHRRQLGGAISVMRASFQTKQRAGRGVPVSRAIARGCARGCGRAYRGGAVRARDCPRETAHAPRPSVPAGVFFAAPSQSLSAETPKGGPGSRLSLLSFYTIPMKVKPFWEQKMKTPGNFSHRLKSGRKPQAVPLSPRT